MKRLAAIISTLCLTVLCHAQVQGQRLVLDFKYDFADKGGANYQGRGEVLCQDKCFIFSSGDVKVYCDGERMWTVNASSHEVVIEPAVELDMNRPEQLLTLFGQNPKKTGLNIEYDDAGLPKSISAILKNGGTVRVSVVKTSLSPRVEKGGEFSFNTASLDSNWVVTNLCND